VSTFRNVVLLSGGVGGARFAHGLAQVVDAERLTLIVNTGDDLVHWGLYVCPDLDTVMYTLAGRADEARGWGLRDETFGVLDGMRAFGAPDWFALGDRDLATHLVRSEALARGRSLSDVTQQLCAALGVRTRVLPMCDTPRRTLIESCDHGLLAFQEWLVKLRAPRVKAVHFEGADTPTAAALAALDAAELIVIGPSNPYVSIDPILSLSGVRERVASKPTIALSPIVHGRAVKGPLAEMLRELAGSAPGAGAIAVHYGELLSGLVVERGDEASVRALPVLGTNTVMGGSTDRARLAREVLQFAEGLK
jgi:LPPG:FO 2-phospho-L-lactate transferase